MKKNIKLEKILHKFKDEIMAVYGKSENIVVRYLQDPDNVDEFTLDWIHPNRKDKQLLAELSLAKVIVATDEVEYTATLKEQNKALILVKNPKLFIAKVGKDFFTDKPKAGIHPTAIIHPETVIGKNVSIGAYTVVGKCKIGKNVIIHNNVTLYDNTIIKDNVIVHAGTVIGTDGLGCERETDGTLIKFPHFGGVIIDNNVEIGANCQIAKGALSNTIIGEGTKINVGCYIAHNVVIGRNVWISAQAKIAGSAKIQDNVTIFIDAIVREQRTIGERCIIGMGAVITKDVPAGETWVGNPARQLR